MQVTGLTMTMSFYAKQVFEMLVESGAVFSKDFGRLWYQCTSFRAN